MADEQISSQAKFPSKNPDSLARDSDVRFSNIVKASPMGILLWQLESDGRLVLVGTNPAADRILGVDCAQFTGQTIEQAFPPLAQSQLPEIYRTVAATGTPWHSDEFAYEDPLIKGIYEVHAFQTSPGQVAAMFNDISDRKEIEASLQAKEADQALILRSVPLVLYSAQASGDFATTWTSGRAYEITGIDAYRFIEESDFWVSRIHPDDRDRAIQAFGRIPETGSCTMEYRWQHADGSWLWFLDQAVLVLDKQAQPKEIIGTWIDITDRKRAEERFKQQQYYLEKAQELGQIGTWELDLKLNKLYWTDENCRIFGVPAGSIVNYEIFIGKVHPDDRKNVDQEWTAALGGKPYDIEHRIVVNNTTIWVREKADVEFDQDGTAVKAIGFTQDITERKQAEQALRQSEERFRTSVLESPFPIMIHAEDGEVLQINKVWTELTGYEPNEMPTLSAWTELAYGERKDIVKSRIDEIFNYDRRIEEGEYVISSKDGKSLIWDFSSAPLGKTPDGRRVVISMAMDVTDRKRAEKEIVNLARFPSENTSPVLRIDLDGKLLYANAASEELLDDWGCQVQHPVPQRWHQLVRNVLESGSKRLEEYELKGRIYSFNIVPLTEASYANLYARDITERKQAEEESSRLAKFPSENPNPVLRISSNGKIIYGNDAAEELLNAWGQKQTDDLPQRYLKIVKETLSSSKPSNIESFCPGGKTFSIVFAPVIDGDYVNVYGLDITERKKADNALRESEYKLRLITDSSSDYILMLDENLNIQFINRVEPGLDKEKLIGTPLYEYVDEHDKDRVKNILQEVINKNEMRRYDTIFHGPDGTIVYFETIASPINSQDKVVGVAITSRNVTEHKLAEERLRVNQRFLEISNRHLKMKPLLKEFLNEVKNFTGCAAVGVRILDEDGNIPYEFYQGFSRKFYESENFLSIKNNQCMCINVITGKVDSELPFYTKGGSFYMNATTRFLATVSEEDKGQTRNVCNQMGYESVALLPIRLSERVLGLIHVADKRENVFPLDVVETLESAAIQLATAIQRVWDEQALRKAKDELEVRVRQRTADLAQTVEELEAEVRDRIRAEKKLQDEQRRLYSVLQMLPGYVILHGPDHKIRFANDRFLELFGEPGPKPCYNVMRKQNHPCDVCQVASVLDAQTPKEWEWTCPQGKTYHVWGYPFTDVDQTQVMLELGIDITERKNLETEVLRISENERQRIGQDLHDSLSQTLSGVSCLSQVLHNKLAAKSMPEAQDVARIESLITESLKLTQTLARGLTPVGVEAEGLMSALRDLASNVENMFNIHCVFQCDQPVLIEDKLVATHTYRIAQEAINNAVRHGQAQNVIISLTLSNADVVLSIEDDGRGLPENITKNAGMGLRIMNYRARTIGATLSVQSGSQGGTSVVCRLKQTPQTEGQR